MHRQRKLQKQKLQQTEREREGGWGGGVAATPLTCKTVVHFRGLVVIVVVSRHYSGILHVIVGLGALRGGLLGACITENHCPNDGLPWRLGGPIIVT